MQRALKVVRFLGTSRDDLRAFPVEVRKAVGLDLMRVQAGLMPLNWKVMRTVGKGCYEIRVSIGGAWRVIYVAKFEAAIYVLHAFQKTTPRTSHADITLATDRYNTIPKE